MISHHAGLFTQSTVDLLERPLSPSPIPVQNHSAILPVGHNQIVTLRLFAD
jgi:hypothetical protein